MATVGELPQWAQTAIYIATTIVTIGVIIAKGWKKPSHREPEGEATVLAATIADRRSVELLVDSLDDLRRRLEELQYAMHRDVTILATDLRDSNRAVRSNTEAIENWGRERRGIKKVD